MSALPEDAGDVPGKAEQGDRVAAAGCGGDESRSGCRIALTPAIAPGITGELVPNWWVMPSCSGSASVPPVPRGQVWGAEAGGPECLKGGVCSGGAGFCVKPAAAGRCCARSLPTCCWLWPLASSAGRDREELETEKMKTS